MNYQSDNLQHITSSSAAQMLKRRYFKDDEISEVNILNDLNYYAWPQVFGSTSGPFGGVGGQAFSTFTIEAWEFMGCAVLFCQNKRLKVTNKFQMGMKVWGRSYLKGGADGG
jgi:hypothetical protein